MDYQQLIAEITQGARDFEARFGRRPEIVHISQRQFDIAVKHISVYGIACENSAAAPTLSGMRVMISDAAGPSFSRRD